MSDSQRPTSQDFLAPQTLRQSKLHTPALHHVASPSPAKARRRPVTERPALSNADVAPVKLPSELFAISTSRSSQGDMALSKALDSIQAAATRLETERTKLVIQSQELQIWDMAREEELLLLRAENEQLEQQLAAVSEKFRTGLGRDGVLDSLQFALRKARQERDAEVREADTLFNQLQEAKAAAQELADMRAAFSAALCSINDDWSMIPLLTKEARELRARADAAVKDPTNLGQKELTTLLRGLIALAARGSELQLKVQMLRGEKTALQQALDAAHQNMADQVEQHQQTRPGAAVPQGTAPPPIAPACGGDPKAVERRSHASKLIELRQKQQHHHEQDKVIASLQRQVSELQGKVAEYRSFLEENQKEIEVLQSELHRSRQAQHPADPVQGPRTTSHGGHAPQGHKPSTHGGRSSQGGARMAGSSVGVLAGGPATDTIVRRQADQQLQKAGHGSQHPVQGFGTPTRHVPSCPSPNSTVKYAGSPPKPASSTARNSPLHQQTTADIAQKIAELQDLALRAQRQALEREADLLAQHEAELAALRQELKQQHAAELAALRQDLSKQIAAELATLRAQLSKQHNQALVHATAREAELSRQHTQVVLEHQQAAAQHVQAVAELHSQMTKMAEQHTRALAEREAAVAGQLQAALEQRTLALQHLHQEELSRVSADAAARLKQALEEQEERLAARNAENVRQVEDRLASELAAREKELEMRFMEQVKRRESEMRQKHAERLAQQAAQLTALHAEQAAGLGLQHAESMADREVELCEQYEQIVLERESVHAAQVRQLEARSVARVSEALTERETQLRRLFEEQMEQALRQQALTKAAEARLSERVADVEAAARRREGEMQQQLEEQGRRVDELELQLSEAQRIADMVAAAAAAAAAATDATSERTESQSQVCDVEGVWLVETQSLRQQVVELEEQLAACRQTIAEREEQLTQQEQLHKQEMTARMEEGERQRAALEREYVETVARMGREHEKASVEARTANELREANLRRTLEQHTKAAQVKERLDKLQAELKEERERHANEAEALRAGVAHLEAGLDDLRNREAEYTLTEQQQNAATAVNETDMAPRDMSVAAEVPASVAAAETWPDGKVLLWPQQPAPAPAHNDVPSASSTATAVPAQEDSDELTHGSVMADLQWLQPLAASKQEPSRCSEQDLAAKLLRTLRGCGKEDGSGPGDAATHGLEPWNSSIELSPRKVPRQGLLQGKRSTDGTAVKETVSTAPVRLGKLVLAGAHGGQARGKTADERSEPSVFVKCEGEEQVAPRQIEPHSGDSARVAEQVVAGEEEALPTNSHQIMVAATDVEAVAASAVSDSDEWGDLVGAPAGPDLNVQQRFPVTDVEPSPGETSSSPSKPASSVRTSSSYDSDTEFYVDDDDDEEQRGRALAAALAQSPRASPPSTPSGSAPPLELQQRCRSQSLQPDSPVGENQQPDQPPASVSDCDTTQQIVYAAGGSQLEAGDHPAEYADDMGEASLPSLDVDLQIQPDEKQQTESIPGAVSGVDLEATFSGGFPVLSPQALQQAVRDLLSEAPCPAAQQLPTAGRAEAHAAIESAFCLTVPHPEEGGELVAPRTEELDVQDVSRREELRTSFSFPTVSPRAALEPALTPASLGKEPVKDIGLEIAEEEDDHDARQRSGVSPTDSVGVSPGGSSPEAARLSTVKVATEGVVGGGVHEWLPADSGALNEEASSPSATRDSGASGHIVPSRTISQSSSSLLGPSSIEYSEGSPTSGLRGSGRGGPGGDVPLMTPNPLFDERSEASLPWSAAHWDAAGESSRTPTPRDADLSLSSTPCNESCRNRIIRLNSHGRTRAPSDGSAARADIPRLPQDCTAASQAPGQALSSAGARAGAEAQSSEDGAGSSSSDTGAGSSSHGTVPASIGAKRTAGSMSWGEPYGDVPDGILHGSIPGVAGSRLAGMVPVVAAVLSPPSQLGPDQPSPSGQVAGGPQQLLQHDGSGDYYTARPRRRMSAFSGGPCREGRVKEVVRSASFGGNRLGDREAPHTSSDEDHHAYSGVLAAGASTGSCGQRRQRRRTGDAPEPEPASPVRRPVDLLRQSWMFAGGVATPLSPRSTTHHGRVQGQVVGHASPPQPKADGPQDAPVASTAATHSPLQTTDVRSIPLRVLAAQSSPTSPVRDSPLTRRRSISSGAPSPSCTALPARGPASPLAVRRLSAGSPYTGSVNPRGGPSHSSIPSVASADAALMLGSARTLDSTGSTPLTAELVSFGSARVPSDEMRRRSRTLLGRAMSRVAELGDQCRALAAAMQAVATVAGPGDIPESTHSPHHTSETRAPIDDTAPASATPAAQPTANTTQTTPGDAPLVSPTPEPPSPPPLPPSPSWPPSPGPIPMRTLSSSQPNDAMELLSMTPPPSVAEDVVGALDRLQGDLLELEQLHYLSSLTLPPPPMEMLPLSSGTSRSGLPAPASLTPAMEDGRAIVEGMQGAQHLMLDGSQAAAPHDENDVQEAAATPPLPPLPPAPSDDAPSAPPLPPVGLGSCPSAVADTPPSPVTAADESQVAVPAASTHSPPLGHPMPGGHSASQASPCSSHPPHQEPESLSDTATGAGASLAGNTSVMSTSPPQCVPSLSPGAQSPSLPGSGSFAATEAGATVAVPSALTSSLDPMLVSLLQQSIQVQLQGQLGQLHSKIAELQRQNEALLLAANVASAPVTPMPSGAMLYQTAPPAGASVVSPLPSAVFTVQDTAQTIGGMGPGGDWGGWVGQGMGGKQGCGLPWPGEAGGEEQMWAGAGSMTPVVQNRANWIAAEASAVSSASRSSVAGRTPSSGYLDNVSLFQAAVNAAEPVIGHVGSVPAAIDEKAAGPYSPEQLSQLPPAVQLFAPPQLRAAALATSHEQQLLRRTR